MVGCVDVISAAFDVQHKTALEVEKWKEAVLKREATLQQQMQAMVEQHEREYATEAQLKTELTELQQQLKTSRTELDETYRNLVRTQESLTEATERNDELSRQHVTLTMRESKVRDHIERLERQVEVSHQHAEAKAREVGELRQDIATINGRFYRAEAKAREADTTLHTLMQTLARKDRDIEEKEMELARLKAAGPLRRSAEDASDAERVAELVAQREKEIMRAMTPRPDWDALNEKHQMRALVNEGATSKSRELPTKRWAELLSAAVRQAQEQQDLLTEEAQKLREKVDQSSLQMAMATSHHAPSRIGDAVDSPLIHGKKQRGGGAGVSGSMMTTPSAKTGKRVRAGKSSSPRGGLGGKAGAAVAEYYPLSSPDFLRATHPVAAFNWSLADVLQHLTAATDYIIAHHGGAGANDHHHHQQQQQHQNSAAGGGLSSSSSSFPESSMSLAASVNLGGTTSSGKGAAAASSANVHHSSSSLPIRGRFSSMSETQIIQHFLDANKANAFVENFQNWLVITTSDPNTRRSIAYNLVYHCRENYFNDVFCKAFIMALGGDIPPETFQRIRTFVLSFRRSFEMCDSRNSGYAPKKVITNMVKSLMNLYSATEQKMVLATLDDLPHMSSRTDTLIDYRVLFGSWERPTHFMTLTAWIFFRTMCIDMEAAVTAVKNLATGHNDLSIGSFLNALQSCDPKRDQDTHRDFVSRCVGQASIKAARVPVAVLSERMRRCYLPRASAFPADPHFSFKEPSLVAVTRVSDEITEGAKPTGATADARGGATE